MAIGKQKRLHHKARKWKRDNLRLALALDHATCRMDSRRTVCVYRSPDCPYLPYQAPEAGQ